MLYVTGTLLSSMGWIFSSWADAEIEALFGKWDMLYLWISHGVLGVIKGHSQHHTRDAIKGK